MKKVEEFRRKYPDGKIDVVCEMKDDVTYINVKAYAKHENDKCHYLTQYQTICFDANTEKLQNSIAEAISNCMMCTGVFAVEDNHEITMQTTSETNVDPTKTRRGRKPKATKEDKPDKEVPMTAEEERNLLEEVNNLSREFSVEEKAEAKTEEIPAEAAEYDVEPNEVCVHTMQQAKEYKVPCGVYKDMFIGELMAIDKKAVEYFATKYKGTDNNVRIAAKIALGLEKTVDF